MKKIEIKRAKPMDIPVIESILLDTVNWLNDINQQLWREEDVKWDALAKSYQIEDFYIVFLNSEPAGCMVLLDYDPFFWPNVAKGEALFIHKLAITKLARKSGVADALINFAKDEGIKQHASSIRLDCNQYREKLRAFYERHSFVCVDEKIINEKWHVAFYVYMLTGGSRAY
jgi:GNAT superfamily N-acetyltransferase